MEFSLTLIPLAFLAGLLTFLAPCTLPLVPAYLAFISGADLRNTENIKAVRKKIFLNGVFFVIGFSLVFIILGTLAGLLGSVIAPWRIWLTRIGGFFIIAFGVWMMGFLNLKFLNFLNVQKRAQIIPSGQAPSGARSFILGASFGFGWTPCAGPIVGSIILLTTAYSTAFQGAFLLFVFSLGLAIPFLIVAWGIGSAQKYLGKISRYVGWVQPAAGVLLVGIGILLVSGRFVLLINYGFQIFQFINYESLQNYL